MREREKERKREKLENKVTESEQFNMKESRRYNVSVLINHHQDLENMTLSVVISTMNVF